MTISSTGTTASTADRRYAAVGFFDARMRYRWRILDQHTGDYVMTGPQDGLRTWVTSDEGDAVAYAAQLNREAAATAAAQAQAGAYVCYDEPHRPHGGCAGFPDPPPELCGDPDPHEPHHDEYGACPGVQALQGGDR